MDSQPGRTKPITVIPPWLKISAAAVVCIIGYGYFNYAFLPVVKNASTIADVRRPAELGQVLLAHNLLNAATFDDPLSPDVPAMNGRLYLKRPYFPVASQSQMLDDSEQALFIAAARNPADYKNFASLTELYSLRARLQPEQQDQWLSNAFDAASLAVELYPGDSETHLQLAQIAEKLGRTDTALKNYKAAVQIENDFREQFRVMYPGKEIFSRLPKEKYEQAKEQLQTLSKKPAEAK